MWTWPVEVPRKMLSEPDDIAVISAPYTMLKGFFWGAPGLEVQTSKSGRGGALSAASGAFTGVTVKKLKDFHCRHRISN